MENEKSMTIKRSLQKLYKGISYEEAKVIKLIMMVPLIREMDSQ